MTHLKEEYLPILFGLESTKTSQKLIDLKSG